MKKVVFQLSIMAVALLVSACPSENTVPKDTDWMHVILDQSDSQEVNLKTLEVTKNSVAAWTRTSLIAVSERPSNVELPEGAQLLIRMQATCSENGASIRFMAAEFRSKEGKILHTVGPGSEEAVSFPPTDGFEYGLNTPGLICAAAAAKCANRSLQWPLKKPVDIERFLPRCK